MRKTTTCCLCTLVTLLLAATLANAQTFSALYNFNGSTSDPLDFSNPGTLAQGRSGNIYTTSVTGGETVSGASANGTVFSMTTGGTLAELYTFEVVSGENNDDGCNPYSGVTLGTDGNYYGATVDCGMPNLGVFFKITSGGTLTPLYQFTGGSDGANPYATPTEGNDGNFYGTTTAGGANGFGTIYKITTSGTLTTLYSFDSVTAAPNFAPLVLGTDGNFYGTGFNGTTSFGVVYKITSAGKFTILYNFDQTHGAWPYAPLIQGSDGNFYGTTQQGGTGFEGVVFKITPTGSLTVLHNINGTKDGATPVAGLVQATDGNFYGVTETGGGTSNSGTIFKISPTKPYPYTVLHTFDGTTAGNPEVTLLQHTNGTFYGLADSGGTYNVGVFYSFIPIKPLAPFAALVTDSGKVGAKIGILGQDFSDSSVVTFGAVAATTVTLSGTTFVTATVPSGATTGSVTVTTSGGTLNSNKTFRVTPQVKSFTPSSGTVGTVVTITGVSLTQTTKVTFGGVAASFTVDSDTQVTATVPTGAKTGKIVVTTSGGSATSTTSFTVT